MTTLRMDRRQALSTAAMLTASTLMPRVSAAQQANRRNFYGLPEETILEQLRTGRILSRRPVGSTSVNYACDLPGEIDMAFKPRSTSHGEAFTSEVAAFRLNRLLRLERVPPAVTRVIPASQLRLPRVSPVTVERDQTVVGAAIFWCPILRESRIDQEHDRLRWSTWLRQGGTIPDTQRTRAEEISTLISFDVLTGNWDRWSGANVPMDSTGHLIYLDNNGGFSEPFGDRMLSGVMRHLRQISRFSRAFVTQVRAMSEASVRAELALDRDAAHLPLTSTQITSLMRRRQAFLAHVDAMITRHREEAVLYFA
ncbi:MAG: hypothetical protein Q8Q09_15500 [Deltaproteobacteria bacterium]|nr:hypothetical protein [Deltaproteobacteria bacterium]